MKRSKRRKDQETMDGVVGESNIGAELIARLNRKEALIGIIGLGYVGLPLALAFCKAGQTTLGFDIDRSKVSAICEGRSYIRHLSGAIIKEALDSGRLSATYELARLSEPDVLIICVPTPLTSQRNPDMSFVERTGESVARYLRKGQLVSFESTTYPGCCEELLIPTLERTGLKCGEDFLFVYSPEREDPANPNFHTGTIPKILGAFSDTSGEVGERLYREITTNVIFVRDLKTAEAVKLTENVFRAVNVALINELKLIFSRMGIDVWEVIEAAKTKPFGFMPFYPGPGLGGHCIPIDPFYLAWKAREFDMNVRFIELAGEINRAMPRHVVGIVGEALSEHMGKPFRGAKILVVGLAYKKNVDDMRESPSLDIIDRLEHLGCDVRYYDPFIPTISVSREHGRLAGRASIELTEAGMEDVDAAVICTDHDGVDYDSLRCHVPLIVDTRNVLSDTGYGATVVRA